MPGVPASKAIEDHGPDCRSQAILGKQRRKNQALMIYRSIKLKFVIDCGADMSILEKRRPSDRHAEIARIAKRQDC
jgi:hypothetical protein